MKNDSLQDQETPIILKNDQFKGVSSFNIKNIKTNTNSTCNVMEQLKSIVIPKQLEKDKEYWLSIIGKWLMDNVAIPIIQGALQKLANEISNGKHKNFDINKISSFKSFENYLK